MVLHECVTGKVFRPSRLCFFQAEDGIRDLVRSRWLGDVYKRQASAARVAAPAVVSVTATRTAQRHPQADDPRLRLSLIHI